MNYEQLLEDRKQARIDKNYAESDTIRDTLDAKLIFTFDTKDFQEVYYLTSGYFKKKPVKMSNRKYLEYIIQRDIRAENNFNSWLFTQKNTLNH